MYWAQSRAQIRAWVGPGNRRKFDGGRSFAISNLERYQGRPPMPWLAPFAPVALSSSENDPMVFGSGPDLEFFRTNSTLDNGDPLIITTDSIIYSPAVVSPDDMVVYYASSNGFLYQRDTDTLEEMFQFSIGGPVQGDIAMNSRGTMIYTVTTDGIVSGIQVADDDATLPPTFPPTDPPPPTDAPTPPPVAGPTEAPTTSAPTTSSAPTAMVVPTDIPVAPPTPPPAPVITTPGPTQLPGSSLLYLGTRLFLFRGWMAAVLCG